MESLAGQTVSHYDFLEKLGSGGMGEIYKARDSRLNRVVAVKVLGPGRTRDPERRRRFIQEAQAASALNHPNIITIFDILPEGDTQYMVMEYVPGKTLHDLIAAGRLPFLDVIQLATQMASALAVAHKAGIIHRDFKPPNVMVTDSGLVKILDFGLAKLTDVSAPAPDAEQPTLTAAPLTREGFIMGTVNYMSPEQAEGMKVDGRSDMFSFGAVLYEMLTGHRAFRGDSGISTLSAVLRDEVKPIHEFVQDVPTELLDLVNRCLRKLPSARWESMTEVEASLLGLKRRLDSNGYQLPQPPKPRVAAVSAASATRPEVFTPVSGLPRQRSPRKIGVVRVVALSLACLVVVALAILTARWATHPKQQAVVAQSSEVAVAKPTPTPAPATVASNPPAVVTNPEPTAADTAPPPEVPSSNPAAPPPSPTTPVVPKATPVPPPTVAHAPVTRPGAAAVLVPLKLNDGVPFRIGLSEDVPLDAEVGRPLQFRVLDGVRSGDTTVIAKGSIVTGTLADLGGKRKFLGERSKVRFKLIAADSVDDAKISVRATPAARADGAESRPFEVPNGTKTKNLIASHGTVYVAYISGDQTVSVHQKP